METTQSPPPTAPAPSRPTGCLVALALPALVLLGWLVLRVWPAAAAPPLPAGTTVRAGGWDYTVLETRRTKTLQAGFMTATAKGEYLVVALEVVNRGRQNDGLGDGDFELVDAAGTVYRADREAPWAWPQAIPGKRFGALGADSRQLPPGVPGRYVVVFDVAPDAQGLQLRQGALGQRVALA